MKSALALLLVILLGALAAAFILAAPVALAWETMELLRMDASAEGVVNGVEIKPLKDEPGFSRTAVNYSFLVDGRRHHSDRVVPGFVGNNVFSDGDDGVARRYRPGQRVAVHFQRSDPNVCSLEYGWFVGSVAVTSVFGGLIIGGQALSRKPVSTPRKIMGAAGAATGLYGLGLPLVVGPAVRVAELPWHGAAWLALLSVCLLYLMFRDEPAEEESDRRSSWELILGSGDGDD